MRKENGLGQIFFIGFVTFFIVNLGDYSIAEIVLQGIVWDLIKRGVEIGYLCLKKYLIKKLF